MERDAILEDRFVVERLAASGGMGEVWRAKDKLTGEPVAVKVLAGSGHGGNAAARRFAQEARLLAELVHPGIVRFVASGTTPEGDPYLAMEWLEGEDLGARLARAGLGVAEAVRLAMQVAEVLAMAHARGVVHRDIKPSNVFLVGGATSAVKVLDFGIARLGNAIDPAGAARAMTRTGVLLGTPGYMAPEQARGGVEVDARADVFSLGCVLYECLTGRPAFVGEHVMALLAKILLEEAPRARDVNADVPPDLDDLVARMLAKDPNGRPADGAAVLAELRRVGPVRPSQRPPRASSHHAALTIREQRLLSIVLAADVVPRPIETPAPRTPDSARIEGPEVNAPTLALEDAAGPIVALRAIVSSFGGHLEVLSGGAVVVTVTGTGTATDQAAHAARCALAMRKVIPDAPMALATGRADVDAPWPVAQAIDRAASLVARREAARGAIHVDEVTAGLLDVGFDLGAEGDLLVLRGEREAAEGTRRLMGKETPCVGREREMATLMAIYDECASEPVARVALVTAPAGFGKSRVRYEMVRALHGKRPRPEVWIGRGDPMSEGSPFGLLAQASRRAIGLVDGEPAAFSAQKLRARVARSVPTTEIARVAAFVGELVGVHLPDEDDLQLRAARKDPMLMGDQIRRAWQDWVAAECVETPLVLVLEDLHWGDLPTVRLVDAAVRALEDRPFFVLALARPEVHKLFPNLWSERDVQELRLGALTKKASEKLVREVLGQEAPQTQVAELVEKAGGNAFYLEELIRAVAEQKGEALPETVLAMVQARLERLDAEARRLLRAAAVFGQIFWRAGVQQLLGGVRHTGSVRAMLDDLVERELVARRASSRFANQEEYVFRHALVREAAYAMLTDADRVLGHRLAGAWLEQAGEHDALALAEHFERGRELGSAASWYRRAAQDAFTAHDLEAAIARADRGLACGAAGEQMGELLLLRANARRWRGEVEPSEADARQSMDLLSRGGAAWCTAAGLAAFAAGRMGHAEVVSSIATTLRQTAPARGADAAYAVALAETAVQVLYFAKEPTAPDGLLAMVADLEARGLLAADAAAIAVVRRARAYRAYFRGDFGATAELIERAANAFEEAGDLRNACVQHAAMGYAHLVVGSFSSAERALEDALAGAERMGLAHVVANVLQNLGLARAWRGALDEAADLEQRSIEMLRAQGDRRLEAGSHLYQSQIAMLAGDRDRAEVESRAGIELSGVSPPLKAHCLAQHAIVLLARGANDEALAAAEEARAMLEAAGGIGEGETLVLLAVAEVLHAKGDLAGAHAAIGKAERALMARAEKISDAGWRRSFLENVPDNARTIELASAWRG